MNVVARTIISTHIFGCVIGKTIYCNYVHTCCTDLFSLLWIYL